MNPSNRNKFLALMGFQLLWGIVLWFSISKLGLGVSTDSVHLLFGGLNLAEQGRLVSFDGGPLLLWPPLYPTLLGGIHLATGMSVFAAAHVLQAACFIGLSICLALLFLKISPDNFALALAGIVLADIGAVMVAGFDLLGPDYVHVFLVVLSALLAAYYIDKQSPRTFVALAAVGMLAMLDRYIGVAAIATGTVCIVWLGGGSRMQRFTRGLVLSLSALPAGLWLLLTSPLTSRRAPISFGENFQWFSRSVLEWYLSDSVIKAHQTLAIALLWILVLGAIVLLFSARRSRLPLFAKPMLLFGLLYLLALFGSASIAYFNKLGGRFLLPLYIPGITLLVVCAQAILDRAQSTAPGLGQAASIGVLGVLTVAAVLALRISVPIIIESHAGESGVGENDFNTAEWHANAAIGFWLAHRPQGQYLLLSNYPDAVAFYTQHPCMPSPRQYSGPYGKVEYPVEGYQAELLPPGEDTYLIWIEPTASDYYYRPADLRPIAQLQRLFASPDGAVYRLSPKEGG